LTCRPFFVWLTVWITFPVSQDLRDSVGGLGFSCRGPMRVNRTVPDLTPLVDLLCDLLSPIRLQVVRDLSPEEGVKLDGTFWTLLFPVLFLPLSWHMQ